MPNLIQSHTMTHYDTDALTKLDLPGARNSQLPTLYVAEDHPQHPASNPGQSYVAMIRPTVAAMEAAEQFERELEVPAGQKEELDAQGVRLSALYPSSRLTVG